MHWSYLGQVRRFPLNQPVGLVLYGKPVVAVRTHEEILAFDDRCPHRGYPLSVGLAGQDEHCRFQLRCSYHGWTFNADGELTGRPGFCESKPPSYVVPKWRTRVAGSCVFISPVSVPVPAWMSDLDDPGVNTIDFHRTIRAAPLDILENLLDPFHTHFIHKTFLRSGSKRVPVDVEAVYDPSSRVLNVEYLNEPTPSGWVSRLFEPERVKTVGRYHGSGAAVLEYWTVKGLSLRVTMVISPSLGSSSRGAIIFQVQKGRMPAWLQSVLLTPFFSALVRQDRVTLERLQRQHELFPQGIEVREADFIFATIRDLLAGREIAGFHRKVKMEL